MGAYAAVRFVLGMDKRLSNLVDSMHDLIGRRFEDKNLTQRVRIPHKKNEKTIRSKEVIVWISLGQEGICVGKL